MFSQKSHASPQEAFEKQEQKSTGFDFLKDLEPEPPKKVAPVFLPKDYKPRNRAVAVRDFPVPPTRVQTPFSQDLVGMAVRDFPFPPSRLQTPFFQDLVQPLLSDASEPTEESECEAKETSKEVELDLSGYACGSVPGNNTDPNSFGLSFEDEGIDMPKVVDSVGLVDPSETSENEYMEEVASNFISLIVPVNTSDSMSFETKELSHKLSNAQDPLDAQSDTEESCSKSNLKNPENLPLRRSNRLLEKAKNTTQKPVPKRKAKTSMEAVPSCRRSKRKRKAKTSTEAAPNSRWSKRITDSKSNATMETNKRKRNLPLRRSNRLLKQGPNTTEKPMPKRKAKASMEAAPSCQRSKRIRDSTLNTTRETNKRKRSKH